MSAVQQARRWLCGLLAVVSAAGVPAKARGIDTEIARYQHHILAVDSHGSALCPIVQRTGTGDSAHYTTSHEAMPDEDTRTLAVALHARQHLHDYLTAMFEEMARQKPREVVIYIHGGLNNIDGAIAKAAYMTDYFTEAAADQHVYYIGICWNSDLSPTFGEHLFEVREGLRQPGRAILSAPATLLADVGSALARTPLHIVDLLFNDAQTVNPNGFTRHRVAEAREKQLENDAHTAHVSASPDGRQLPGKMWDVTRWFITAPVKVATLPLIDTFGTEPWKNMLRRTRTMFERETNFVAEIDDPNAHSKTRAPGPVSSQLRDAITYTGRAGATRLFCGYASDYLTALANQPKFHRPTITLIGHSMGAIVAAEILHRAHFDKPLPLDNVVVMAAACSVNDFRNKMIPYLACDNQAKGKRPGEQNTRFYNLCLNDNAERAEKNPGEFDITPRGSLLVWIDSLYQEPESEYDRTLGRWENAILSTDDIPDNVLRNTTIKSFGRNRAPDPRYAYTIAPSTGKYLSEPTKHGEFSRFDPGKKESTNFAFWRPIYWDIERQP